MAKAQAGPKGSAAASPAADVSPRAQKASARSGPSAPKVSGSSRSPKVAARAGSSAAARARPAAARTRSAYADPDATLPPWERGPVRAYVRDVVDSRRHLTGLFMPVFAMALITTVGPASELARTLQLASLAVLAVMAVEVLVRGVQVTRMARAEFPGVPVSLPATTFYSFMRAHRPRRMRTPRPRVAP